MYFSSKTRYIDADDRIHTHFIHGLFNHLVIESWYWKSEILSIG